jgi:hypothetical protein
MNIQANRMRRGAVFGGALLLAAAMLGFVPGAHAVSEPSATAAATAPIPPGMARIWLYRAYEPFQSEARPYVRLNGAIAGVSEPVGAFYRDVSPGTYTVTVDSEGRDVNQFTTVSVAAGEQAFVKVMADASWDSGGGGGNMGGAGGWARPTFYTRQVQPQAAATEISAMPLYNGS